MTIAAEPGLAKTVVLFTDTLQYNIPIGPVRVSPEVMLSTISSTT
jgi:hypothetical protein